MILKARLYFTSQKCYPVWGPAAAALIGWEKTRWLVSNLIKIQAEERGTVHNYVVMCSYGAAGTIAHCGNTDQGKWYWLKLTLSPWTGRQETCTDTGDSAAKIINNNSLELKMNIMRKVLPNSSHQIWLLKNNGNDGQDRTATVLLPAAAAWCAASKLW